MPPVAGERRSQGLNNDEAASPCQPLLLDHNDEPTSSLLSLKSVKACSQNFFEPPETWLSLFLCLEGWSVFAKAFIGASINGWIFFHHGFSESGCAIAGAVTGAALLVVRGKNALANSEIYQKQKQFEEQKELAQSSLLYNIIVYPLKYNAAVCIGLIDYTAANVSLLNALAPFSGITLDKLSNHNPLVWFSVVFSAFIPYQFVKFRVNLILRGLRNFFEFLNKYKDHWLSCAAFLSLTVANAIYFAVLNAFLGSSTLRRFCLLVGIPSFWSTLMSDKEFDKIVGWYAGLSGLPLTISNAAVELAPSPRRRNELWEHVKKPGAVKYVLFPILVLDVLVNLMLVFLVTLHSELIKPIPSYTLKVFLSILIAVGRIIPYAMLNLSKIVPNFGKLKQLLHDSFENDVETALKIKLWENGHIVQVQKDLVPEFNRLFAPHAVLVRDSCQVESPVSMCSYFHNLFDTAKSGDSCLFKLTGGLVGKIHEVREAKSDISLNGDAQANEASISSLSSARKRKATTLDEAYLFRPHAIVRQQIVF